MLTTLLTLISTLVSPGADPCRYTAERTATIAANGAQTARIIARAGSLRIEGREGLSEVRVRGTACTSHERYLDGITLETGRSGDEVRVEAEMPTVRGIGSFHATLELVIEVPAGMTLYVSDTSGSAEISGVAAVDVEDGSGELTVRDIAGPVRVEDGSGSLTLERIAGDLWVSDGSGGMDIREVEGSTVVDRDGSGSIDIDDVRGAVLIRRDGSGSISVARIGGDFTVGSDGSGGISHRDVSGTVRIPSRR